MTGARRGLGGAAAVGAGIFLSRIAGLVRQRVIAYYLGTADADTITAALRIPNVLQNLLGEGVLSASFVPAYARLRGEGRNSDAAALARLTASALALLCAALVFTGILLAPWLVRLIAPGFDDAKTAETVSLVRITFPGMGLLVMSAWCLGVQNAHRKFFLSYASPVIWNAAIIAALVLASAGSDTAGGIRGLTLPFALAWGAVAGSALQFAIQLPVAARLISVAGSPDAPGVRTAFATVRANFGPAVLSRGAAQLSAWIDQAIASLVSPGALAVLFNTQIISMLPTSLFGMSVAASELTELSNTRGADVEATIRERLGPGLRMIAVLVIPSAVAFLLLGDVVAGGLLRTGRFSDSDVQWVWATLAGSAAGLLAGTFGRLYSAAWFALHDTRTPARIAVVRVTISAVLGAALALGGPRLLGVDAKWGVAGITIASGVAAWCEYALLKRRLDARVGATGIPARFVLSLWAAASAAAAFAWLVQAGVPQAHPLIVAATVLGAYGAAYFALLAALGIPEGRDLLRRLTRRLAPR
ncbi:MAG: murein biosynthesis integral membrane protein MurJ [Gemmatimonadetes bacterium]|nr:murein biosynthesis integral membrane protein MurJ [Gemmatimonadota bacterium]